jgi:hypothetical protein
MSFIGTDAERCDEAGGAPLRELRGERCDEAATYFFDRVRDLFQLVVTDLAGVSAQLVAQPFDLALIAFFFYSQTLYHSVYTTIWCLFSKPL